jgi:predicted Rossmann fold nucleotide-binding protein DprA/Smf involved in DNA uptake
MTELSRILRADRAYPGRLVDKLVNDAPEAVRVAGSAAILSKPLTAFLCSKETPGATILKSFDQAAAWRDAGVCVISGFHSPLEQQCLAILLRGKQPIVMALARGFGTLRLPAPQRKALDEGRLTVISQFPETETHTTKESAYLRNRLVAALADEVVFAYVAPGGSLARLSGEVGTWQTPFRQLHTDLEL